MAASTYSYQPIYSTDVNKQLMQAQQQQALAQGLLQQGLTPINTDNRMVGKIAYKISPWEGVSKLAQALTGAYGLSQAPDQYAAAFTPPDQQQSSSPSLMQRIGNALTGSGSSDQVPPDGQSDSVQPVTGPQQLSPISGMPSQQDALNEYRNYAGIPAPPIDAQRAQMGLPVGTSTGAPQPSSQQQQMQQGGTSPQQPWSPYSPMGQQIMGGDPRALAQYGTLLTANPDTARAGAELLTTAMKPQLAGPTAMYAKEGENAANFAPPGTLPPGVGAPANPLALGNVSAGSGGFAPPQPPAAGTPAPAGVPPMPASPLTVPQPQGGAIPPPPAPTAMATGAQQPPNPAGYATTGAYQAALDAYKAGQSAQAAKGGENLSEAQKGMAQIDSRIGNAKSIIQQMQALAPAVPYGSYGVGETRANFSDLPGVGDDKTSAAYHTFNTLNQNLFTQELPGIVGASGGRIDIPLVNAIKGASAVDLDSRPAAKLAQLNQLSSMLDKVQQNAHLNYQALGGVLPPATNSQAVTHIWTPQGIVPIGGQQ